MIDKLTDEQEKQLVEYRKYCLDRGRATDEIDKSKLEPAITRMYELSDKKKPYFWYCDSVSQVQLVMNILENKKLMKDIKGANLWDNLRANLGANLRANLGDNLRANLGDNLRANLGDNLRANLWANIWANIWANLWANIGANLRYINTSFLGQQDYYWIAFYQYPKRFLSIKYKERDNEIIDLWETIAESGHWWWAYENIVFISHKPTLLLVDDRGRLHNDEGPAIQYRDGYAQWYLHGISVPQELAEIKKEDMKADDILKYDNAEVRMQCIKKMGVGKLKEKGELKAKRGSYELIDMKSIIPNSSYAPYLFMLNPSTDEIHAEGVHPDCKTIQQALNWRAGNIRKSWSPFILT
ncbi:MAG: hypothetical protein PHX80_03830 [Candidatus Nanoarchaeia archaeon]|nr:hypothetical protein [Candidatus Nanoarchaeia archaeon]